MESGLETAQLWKFMHQKDQEGEMKTWTKAGVESDVRRGETKASFMGPCDGLNLEIEEVRGNKNGFVQFG